MTAYHRIKVYRHGRVQWLKVRLLRQDFKQRLSRMKVHKVMPKDPGWYYRLSPGPLSEDAIDWDAWDLTNADMLHVDRDAWDLIMEPLIIGRILDYDSHGKVEVPRRVWGPIMDDLKRLHRIAKDLECFNEFCVEFGWDFRIYPNQGHADRNLPKMRQELLLALEEILEWVAETLKTHSTITILGIRM